MLTNFKVYVKKMMEQLRTFLESMSDFLMYYYLKICCIISAGNSRYSDSSHESRMQQRLFVIK